MSIFDKAKALQDAQGVTSNLKALRGACQQVQTLMAALTKVANETWPAAITAKAVEQADLDLLKSMLAYWTTTPETPKSAADMMTDFLKTDIGK